MAKFNLYHIKEVKTVEELYSYYDDIVRYTKAHITNDGLVYDIVHDSLIRLINYIEQGKDINGGYIALTLSSQHKRYLTNERKRITEFKGYHENLFEDDFDESLEDKQKLEVLYRMYDDKIKSLKWYDKIVFELSFQMPLSKLSEDTKISYYSLRHTLIKTYDKLGLDYKNRTI